MMGWHHRLNGCEFEQTLGDSEGQESLVYCSLWGCKDSDTSEQLNNNDNNNGSLLLTEVILEIYILYILEMFPYMEK